MDAIGMLDCTLRDGGWVNQFGFGTEMMRSILDAVEHSGIEYVELGYLNAQNGSAEGRSEYSDTKAIDNMMFNHRKCVSMTYLVMIDYGKYPAVKLPGVQDTEIDGIRLCFHQKDAREAIQMGQEILEKGYQLMLQPMVSTRYTDETFKELILYAQEKLKGLSAFYLVDSFGSMGLEEVVQRLLLADSCLKEEISLGLHTHNHQQLSFQHAAAALRLGLNRKLMIDGTLAGMGKGPGNMPTEDFAEYLNQNYGKTYDLERLRAAAEGMISPMKKNYFWGYRPEFFLSAKYCLSPSYAKWYMDKYHLPIETVNELLLRIPEEKKDSFDSQTAEAVWKDYKKKSGKVKGYGRLAGCQGI